MPRKTRKDSKLDNLPPDRFEALRDGLLGDWGYQEALDWLDKKCNVTISISGLSAFFARHCAPVLKERRQLAVLRAQEFTKAAKSSPVDWDAAAMEKLNQIFFEILLQPDVDDATAKRFGDMLLKDKSLNLDLRKMRLLEKKAKRLDDAKKSLTAQKDNGGLSEETLEIIERTLGML